MTMTVLLVAARPQVNFGAAGNAEESPSSSSLSSTDGTADADKVVDLRHYYNHHHHHGGGGGGYYNSYPYYNNYGYGGYGGYYGR